MDELRRYPLVAGVLLTLAACTSTPAHHATPSSPPAATSSPASIPALSSSSPRRSTPVVHRTTHPAAPASTPKPPVPQRSPPPAPAGLPLGYPTGTATRVITVVAPSTGSTTATLQGWQKTGTGWTRHGTAINAHLGADGLSSTPSESRSATPIGSFTLTQAFGADSNPGTGLPYLHTDLSDWWISEAGPQYNTLQRCGPGCAFAHAPNEHLATELPFYNYAVVIDYNTRNAPGGVRAGAGSAFFLHVTDGNATAGCVSIPQSDLVSIMQWLTPAGHPRILIGVGS